MTEEYTIATVERGGSRKFASREMALKTLAANLRLSGLGGPTGETVGWVYTIDGFEVCEMRYVASMDACQVTVDSDEGEWLSIEDFLAVCDA